MVLLNNNETNKIIRRFDEFRIYDVSYYIFVFENNITQQSAVTGLTDTSSYDKYNEFELDLSGGTFLLDNNGTLKIYESETDTLDINDAHLIDYDRYFVRGDEINYISAENKEITKYKA